MSRPSATHDTPAPIGNAELIPREGWCVLHVFYRVEHSQWSLFSAEEKIEALTDFTELVQEIRAEKDTHVLTFSMVSPKADIGMMILCPGLHQLNAIEKRLGTALGPDVLQPVYSYLSMTEGSEYTTTNEQYAETLKNERGLDPESDEFAAEMETFKTRMAHYLQHRLYPVLPDWPIMCFYPMSKRRSGEDNWYSLSFDERKKLMGGHQRTGMSYKGRILQLITGSTGLDDHEWGVTLLAHDMIDIKSIVYEMRFDEVSARYGEFGEFFIGVQLPLDQLFKRVGLRD